MIEVGVISLSILLCPLAARYMGTVHTGVCGMCHTGAVVWVPSLLCTAFPALSTNMVVILNLIALQHRWASTLTSTRAVVMEALCLPCNPGLQHHQQISLCGKPAVMDCDEAILTTNRSSGLPDGPSGCAHNSKPEVQQQKQLTLPHVQKAMPACDPCQGRIGHSTTNDVLAAQALHRALLAESSPSSTIVATLLGPTTAAAEDQIAAEWDPSPASSQDHNAAIQQDPQISTPAATAVAGSSKSPCATAPVSAADDAANTAMDQSPTIDVEDVAAEDGDLIEDDVAAALGLVLLHVQPPGAAAASDEDTHSVPGDLAPQTRAEDTQEQTRLDTQQQGQVAKLPAGISSRATSASGFKAPARQQGISKHQGLAGFAASPNKQRAATARVRAAKKQGHRLDYIGLGVGLSAPVAPSRQLQRALLSRLQATAASVAYREPNPAARNTVAAAQAAAATPASAADLLEKVQQALQKQQQQGDSSVRGTTAAAVTDPASILAAAAAPWYPPGAKKAGFAVVKQGKHVPRKLYVMPSSASGVPFVEDRKVQVGSKRKRSTLLQVLQHQLQQEQAAAVDWVGINGGLDVCMPARRTAAAAAATAAAIKELTDAEMERKLQQQQRQQQSAPARSPSSSPSAAHSAPQLAEGSEAAMHEAAAALVQAAVAAIAAQEAQAAEEAEEADRRLNPRRKRKMPSKLDDTLSTDCALQIMSGRGPRSSQPADWVGRSAAARAGSGSPETAAAAMTRIKKLLVLEQQSQPQKDAAQLLKEQLSGAATLIKSAVGSSTASPAAAAAAWPPAGDMRQHSSIAKPTRLGGPGLANPKQQQATWQQHAWWVGRGMCQRDMQKQWWDWAEREQQKIEKQEMEDLLSRYAGSQPGPKPDAEQQRQPENNSDDGDGQDKQSQQKPQLGPGDMGSAVWSCLARQPAAAAAAAEAAVQGGMTAAFRQLSTLATAINRAAAADGAPCAAAATSNPALAAFIMPGKQLADLQQQQMSRCSDAVVLGSRPLTRHAAAAVKASGVAPEVTTAADQGTADPVPVPAVAIADAAARRAARHAQREEAALAAAAAAGAKKRSADDMVDTSEHAAAALAAAEADYPGSQPSTGAIASDEGTVKKARVREHLYAIFGNPGMSGMPGMSGGQPGLPALGGDSSSSAAAALGGGSSAAAAATEVVAPFTAAPGFGAAVDNPYVGAHFGQKQQRRCRKPRGPPPMLKNMQQLQQMMQQQQNQQRLEFIMQKADIQRQQQQQLQTMMQKAAQHRQQQEQQARVQALMERIAAQQQQRELQRAEFSDDDDDSPTAARQLQKAQQPGLFQVVLGQSQSQQQRQQHKPPAMQQLQANQPAGGVKMRLEPAGNKQERPSPPVARSIPPPEHQQQHQQRAPAVVASASQPGIQAQQQQRQPQQAMIQPTAQRHIGPHPSGITISAGVGNSCSDSSSRSGTVTPQQQQQQAAAAQAVQRLKALHAQAAASQQQQPGLQPGVLQRPPMMMQQQQQMHAAAHMPADASQPQGYIRPPALQQLPGMPRYPHMQLHINPAVQPQAMPAAVSAPVPQMPYINTSLPAAAPVATPPAAPHAVPAPVAAAPVAPAPAPAATSRSAAVAASRARLLAALGGDDDTSQPRASPAAPSAAATPAAGVRPRTVAAPTPGQLSSGITSLQPRPGAAGAVMQGGGRGMMYVPVMPMTFMQAPALLQRLPPRQQQLQQPAGMNGNVH